MIYFIMILAAFLGLVALAYFDDKKKRVKNSRRFDVLMGKIHDTAGFECSKTVAGVNNLYIFALDHKNRNILYVDEEREKMIPFDMIQGMELLENGNVILSRQTSHILCNGSKKCEDAPEDTSEGADDRREVSTVEVRIKLRSETDPEFVISCFDTMKMTITGRAARPGALAWETYTDGMEHARKICDIICLIADEAADDSGDWFDELQKMAEMKEKGLLTDYEFDAFKQRLIEQGRKG